MKSLSNDAHIVEILERLARTTPDSTRRWGRMTSHQMICHLADAYRMAMGDRVAAASRASALNRYVIKPIALYSPMPWPKGVPTMAEADQERGGTKPVEFARDREELGAHVTRFAARPRDFVFPAHPIFGDMSERDWLRWGYLHAHHHLTQFGV